MKESTAVEFWSTTPTASEESDFVSPAHKTDDSFFKPHFVLVSLLESREISE